jgi:hypothetical protein
VVECLLCKCEALTSNPSPIKKKKITILNPRDGAQLGGTCLWSQILRGLRENHLSPHLKKTKILNLSGMMVLWGRGVKQEVLTFRDTC